jgi:hypothetical protein
VSVVKIPDCVARGNLTADTSGSLTKFSGISQPRGQFDMSIYGMIATTEI